MMNSHRLLDQIRIVTLLALALLWGCSPAPQTVKKQTPPPAPAGSTAAPKPAVPDMMVRMASLDLTKPPFKIEQSHIDQLAALLHKEGIDIFTIQGVSRYPGVTTRVDIVDALGRASGMRTLFEENINISGRQTGNAVFS